MTIAFNLQVVFLHRRKVSSFSDRWYIPVALMVAIIINIPPLVYDRFGYDSNEQKCLYRGLNTKETQMWVLWTFLVPISFALIYCTTVLVIVMCKLIFEHRKLVEAVHIHSNATLTVKAKRKKIILLKLVGRIVMYAAVPLVNVTGIVVEYVWMIAHANQNVPLWIIYWAIVGSCLPGLSNFIAFIFDPAIHNALRKVRRDLIDNYGYEKSSYFTHSSPPLSPSEAYFQNFPRRNSHPIHLPTTTTFSPSPTNYPPSTPRPLSLHLSVSPNYTSPSRRTSANYGIQKKKDNRILQWIVRAFLDTKKEPVSFSMLQPRFETVEGYNAATQNNSVNTLPGQNLDIKNSNDYISQDLNTIQTDKRTFARCVSNEQTRESIDQMGRVSTTIAYDVNNPNPYSDTNTLTTTSNCSGLDCPVSIRIHPPPDSVTGVIEIGSSRRSNRSDSITSVVSRDSVDNDLSIY
ncbi:986_t:CDS:2 [Acaulospora colombiana]|uniref:986_t:CDS:1 n=1 Tax=Acaulospora colombiana TaxID=27376 RepID=A0ACA9KUG2_9GLOM|nr:986_t:CDS:2 [Acaulospora colombiana]